MSHSYRTLKCALYSFVSTVSVFSIFCSQIMIILLCSLKQSLIIFYFMAVPFIYIVPFFCSDTSCYHELLYPHFAHFWCVYSIDHRGRIVVSEGRQ